MDRSSRWMLVFVRLRWFSRYSIVCGSCRQSSRRIPWAQVRCLPWSEYLLFGSWSFRDFWNKIPRWHTLSRQPNTMRQSPKMPRWSAQISYHSLCPWRRAFVHNWDKLHPDNPMNSLSYLVQHWVSLFVSRLPTFFVDKTPQSFFCDVDHDVLDGPTTRPSQRGQTSVPQPAMVRVTRSNVNYIYSFIIFFNFFLIIYKFSFIHLVTIQCQLHIK